MTTSAITQRSPQHLGLPPPTASEHAFDLDLELVDAGRVAGRIRGDTVSFFGFADAVEAAHAAWLAHRTIARRLARLRGTRPIPIDTERLAIQRRDDADVVLAGGIHGEPIATLLHPDDHEGARTLPGSFGFAIRVPTTTEGARAREVQVRGMAYQAYRALRKSGLRWALWRPAPGPVATLAAERAVAATRAAPSRDATAPARRRRPASTSAVVATVVLGALAIAIAIAALSLAPATVTAPVAGALVLAVGASGLYATRTLVRRRLFGDGAATDPQAMTPTAGGVT